MFREIGVMGKCANELICKGECMKKGIAGLVMILSLFCLGISNCYSSTSGDLVSLLMSQLGVTQQQAEGGAGAVFKTAQDNLQADEYATLTRSVPEITSLVEKAPVVKQESSGWMSSASSLLGDSGKKVESTSSLLDSFSSLGMDGEMLAKFTPIISDYLQKNGGDICVKLLQSVL
jgi:hypothetical protein